MKDDIKEKLHALFVEYKKKLPDKFKNLQEQWQALTQQWDTSPLKDFHRAVHSLCGSAGTYCYPSISNAARELEVYLKPLLDNTSISLEEQQVIVQCLQAIEREIHQTINTQETFDILLSVTQRSSTAVYLLDNNESLIKNLSVILEEAGYTLRAVKDIKTLENEFLKNPPLVLIIDIDKISAPDSEYLVGLCRQQKTKPCLFCIAQNGDILTRLKSVRLGSTAFFQKPIDPLLLAKKIEQSDSIILLNPYRILIVDDSLSLAQYYSLILKEAGMIVQYITNPLLLIETMEDFQPDLLLMDIYMPQCSGLELACVLRQEPQYTSIPILFLSTEEDRVKQLSALNLGGDDFLVKPIVPHDLVNVVISRAKRAGVLSSFIKKDSLTGLLNHTNILQRLEIEIIRAERNQETLSFIMIDIDHFKQINDNYGHPVGDLVIKKLSSLLMSSFRKTDIIGRYGGEEFAVILLETTPENARKNCDDLRIKFSKFKFNIDNHSFKSTISAGIASYPDLSDLNTLISAADNAFVDSVTNPLINGAGL